MLGWFKKKPKGEHKSKIDKLVMGIIVGSAIGSVIGMSIAPKKGKETREYLNQKGKEILRAGQEISETIRNPHDKYHPRALNKGFLKKITGFKNILLNRFKKGKSTYTQQLDESAGLVNKQSFAPLSGAKQPPRKIPNEHIEEDKIDIIKF